MPRDGSGIYSVPAGTTATPNTTIESAKYNAFTNDIAADQNNARPITAGGTGETTARLKDGTWRFQNTADATKLLALSLSGLTAATTRTLTVQDKNGTIALTTDLATLGSPTASTSGTSIDFGNIPAGVKRIFVNFAGVSTNGSSNPIVQIGDSGGIEATGYLGSAGLIQNAGTSVTANETAGFLVYPGWSSATVIHGTLTLTLLDASTNTWVSSLSLGNSNSAVPCFGGGSKSLSATLDRVRITTAGGSDAFDAGKINILYEANNA